MARPPAPPSSPAKRKAKSLIGHLAVHKDATSTKRVKPPKPVIDTEDTTPDEKGKEDRHQELMDLWKAYNSAWSEQMHQELAQLRFEAVDMWPEDVRTERGGNEVPGMAPVTSRPCLEINKIDQPIQQNISLFRNAQLGVIIAPRGGGADKEDARIRQGLIRHIEVESGAGAVRRWAFERSLKVGRGFYRLIKKHVVHDGKLGMEAFDSELALERILNQGSVYPDPAAKYADFRDMDACFITEDLLEAVYKQKYPKSSLTPMGDAELMSLNDPQAPWISGEPGARAIRVCEGFRRVMEERTLVAVEVRDATNNVVGRQVGWKDQLVTPLPNGCAIIRQRDVETYSVKWARFNVAEILEEGDWEGSEIPVFVAVGKEYNVAGRRFYKGMIANAMDANKTYNYMTSALVEAIALAPRAPWVLAEGQAEGYEKIWKTANTKAWAYLTYKPKTIGNLLAPPPQRQAVEAPVQAITIALAHADSDIKATTAWSDPSLGQFNPNTHSGKAIQALQMQSLTSTSNYLDDMAELTITREGRCVNEMLPYVYDRPGRVQQILGPADEPEHVMLNHPYTKGQDGSPQMLPQGANGGFPNPLPQGVKYHNLHKGQFSVVVKVGKSQATRRMEADASLTALATAAPGLVPRFADLWVRSKDIPYSDEIADRLTPPDVLQQQDQEGGAQNPQLLASNFAKATQMIQLLTKELNAKNDLIAKETLKLQSQERIAAMNAQSAERRTAMTAQASLAASQVKVEGENARAMLDHEAERMSQIIEAGHEARMAALDHAHEHALEIFKHSAENVRHVAELTSVNDAAHRDRVFKGASEGANRAHEAAMAELEHRHALAQQAAAPEPESEGAEA